MGTLATVAGRKPGALLLAVLPVGWDGGLLRDVHLGLGPAASTTRNYVPVVLAAAVTGQ